MRYIHGSPTPKVSKFNMGDLSTHFARRVHLVVTGSVQIRHNALESGRVAANKVLFDKYGETGYRLQLCVYPHIILRENKMIATAGADRLQEGMRRAFGKPTGRAARMVSGQSILIIYVPEDGVETARKACETAGTKMPIRTRIIVEEAPPEPESHAAVEEIAESPPSQMIEEEAVEEVAPTISAKA
jgi:large subunit ribosomal protein L10e